MYVNVLNTGPRVKCKHALCMDLYSATSGNKDTNSILSFLIQLGRSSVSKFTHVYSLGSRQMLL